MIRLHERRYQLEQRGSDARVQRDAREVAVRDDLRLGARGVKISHDVRDARAVIEIHRIFKVQVQAAVVEIDRADDKMSSTSTPRLAANVSAMTIVSSRMRYGVKMRT